MVTACGGSDQEKTPEKQDKETKTKKVVLSEIDSLTLAIETESTKALFMARANAYNDIGRFDKSIVDADRVYQFNKMDVDNIIFYADKLMAALIYKPELIEQAKPLYEQVIEMQPENEAGYLGMAKVYTLIDNPDEAFKFINKALEINNTLSEAYYLKGFIYQSQRKFKLAASSYQTSIEQDPEFTEGYIILGALFSKYADVKSQTLAEGYFRSALSIEPKNKDAFYGIGMLYQNQNKLDSAMIQYKKIVALDTTYAIAYYNQGYLFLNRSDFIDSAIYYFEKSIVADTLYTDAYSNLGYAYEKKDDKLSAKKYYLKALETNPEHEIARKNLETLYK